MIGKQRGSFFIDLLSDLCEGIVELAGELLFELLAGIFDGL